MVRNVRIDTKDLVYDIDGMFYVIELRDKYE